MERGSVATDARSDDEQVVIKWLRRASIVGERGRDDNLIGASSGSPHSVRSGVLSDRREPEGLAPEAAESEVYRLWGGSEAEGSNGVALWSGNGEGGLGSKGESKRRLHSEDCSHTERRERERESVRESVGERSDDWNIVGVQRWRGLR